MKILCVIDAPEWAFHKNCLALRKYGKNDYNIRFGMNDKYRNAFTELNKFDLILYWTDVRPDYIVKYKLPKSKTVVMIRSDIRKTCKLSRYKYWQETNLLKDHIKCFMVANHELLKFMRKKFPMKKSFYAPGGVDLDKFYPSNNPKVWPKTPRVGWSGSKNNFSAELRGVKLISSACKQLGWEFRPAYREKRWRTQSEMINYYHNEIDLYCDLWIGAGRQNGLLEAGACGIPLVACDKGIARELTAGGLQVALRDVNSVKAALQRAWRNKEELSKQIASRVYAEWGWKLHVERWEEIFNQIKRM